MGTSQRESMSSFSRAIYERAVSIEGCARPAISIKFREVRNAFDQSGLQTGHSLDRLNAAADSF